MSKAGFHQIGKSGNFLFSVRENQGKKDFLKTEGNQGSY